MHYRKHILAVVMFVLGGFLLSCSNEEAGQSSDAQSAREVKAKIVYFSIPG